ASIDELSDKLEAALEGGKQLQQAVLDVIRDSYGTSSRVVFNGDGYSEEWHNEAEQRGLLNLRTTPDALPELVSDSSKQAFSRYEVLSERELESRFEVLTEQYVVNINIEAEIAAGIARTMILPAALRHLVLLKESDAERLVAETEGIVDELVSAIFDLEKANEEHPEDEGLAHARYMRDVVVPAMDRTRAAADQLERVVADDLWPLPKYQEMLFIK
ncbi:MAG: glutamine synthetase type III, partial [Thermoleophilaceae bacterium]